MLKTIFKEFILLIVTHWPGYFGRRMRYLYYRKKMAFLHPSSIIDTGVYIMNPETISIGKGTYIDKNVIIIGGLPNKKDIRELKVINNPDFDLAEGGLLIGDRCHIAPNCLLSGIGGLKIGNDSCISSSSKIYSFSHHYRSYKKPNDRAFVFGAFASSDKQCLLKGAVVIENNVGVAVDCVILPGVTIETESFVSIGSVVRNRVKRNSIVSGNPATFIRKRFGEDVN
jgi:acetyltransferase-like isoleucine patch superfamily enzyme